MNYSVICADMRDNDNATLNDDTVASYVKALKRIFVIEDMRAWNPNLRSKTAIRTSDTRYFTDPSIGVAALGIGPADFLNDLNTFGLFFEALAVRDLRVFADVLDGGLYHYRDRNGLECDAVLRARSPRQVITPGDGGTGDSSSSSPYHRVNIVVAPLSHQAIDVLPAVLSRGRIIVSILIRFLGTSQTAFFSLHRGFSRYDIDCPPCPSRCPPCPPVTINLLACFWTRHKKGGQPVLSP